MKRVFIVTLPASSLQEELPLLARVVRASFYLSHDIRRDVRLVLYFPDVGRRVVFSGEKLRHVHVDEHSLLGVLRKINTALKTSAPRHRVHYGVRVEEAPFLVEKPVFLVSERGLPLELAVRVRDACREFSILLSHGARVEVRAEEVRVTTRPKPVDISIAITNMLLDRLCAQE